MTKTLYLIRHAQSYEKAPDQQDKERELNSIGLQNSTRMGINLNKKGITPNIIISSPAKRAVQTAGLIAEQLNYEVEKIHQNDEIYEASARTLLQVVNRLKDNWGIVVLVGHNPAISYLAEYISNSEIGTMSTCGVATIQFSKSWNEVSEHSGELISYEYPDLLNF